MPIQKIYHMDTIIKEGQIAHAQVWMDMLDAKARGDREQVKALAKPLLDGYTAAVDYPASIFYEELMELYPDAKCVLTTREFDSWYKSVLQTLYEIRQVQEPTWMMKVVPFMIQLNKSACTRAPLVLTRAQAPRCASAA